MTWDHVGYCSVLTFHPRLFEQYEHKQGSNITFNVFRAHLDLVEGPFFIQTLDPHRGAGLVVRHIPALLT